MLRIYEEQNFWEINLLVVVDVPWNGTQRIGKGTRRVGNQKKNRRHPDYIIIKIDQVTKNSPGVLRRLAVIYTPVNDHQMGPVGKTREAQNNDIKTSYITARRNKTADVDYVVIETKQSHNTRMQPIRTDRV